MRKRIYNIDSFRFAEQMRAHFRTPFGAKCAVLHRNKQKKNPTFDCSHRSDSLFYSMNTPKGGGFCRRKKTGESPAPKPAVSPSARRKGL